MRRTDYTRQYDGWSDGPTNPLNILADINALLGIILLHGDYFSPAVGDPILQDVYGDTSYYLIPTERLPLVSWLDFIPYVGPFVASVLDAPLRVVVEAGYDRTTSPGEPTGWSIFYTPNLLRIPVNLAIAGPTGWDDAISQAAGDPNLRPFHTQPAGPYGVGGPPVTMDPLTNDEQDQQLTTLANDENNSVTTNLTTNLTTDSDKKADVAGDVQQQSTTPQTDSDVTETDPPAADTPDADPPSTPSVDQAVAAEDPQSDRRRSPAQVERSGTVDQAGLQQARQARHDGW